MAMPAAALDPARTLAEFVRNSWSTDSGLPHSTVRNLVQTRDGYLWLATHEGLVRFDGRQFRVFNEGNTSALRGTGISTLQLANDGGLWIGLRDGGVSRLRDGVFSAVVSPTGIPNGTVTQLRETPNGVLWVGTSGNGVGHVDLKAQGSGKRFSIADGLPHYTVQSLDVLEDGRVLVGTARGMVVFRDFAIVKDAAFSVFANAPIGVTHRDAMRRLWVSVNRKGLYMADPLAASPEWSFHGKDDGVPDLIRSINVDRDGAVWMGGVEGLVRMPVGMPPPGSRARRGARRDVELMTARNGLSSNHVRDIFEDAEGNIWVGTEGGLDRFRDGLISMWDAARGLTEDFSRTVIEARDGSVWVGTANGLFQMRDGSFKRYDESHGLASSAVLALAEDADGELWVGTNAGGVHVFRGGRFVNKGPRWGADSSPVRAILATRSGELWVGSATGLFAVNRETDAMRPIRKGDQSSPDQILTLHEARDGSIWVGTRDGLHVYRNGTLVNEGKRRGIETGVFSVIDDGENTYLATSRGIIGISGNKVVSIGNEKGLPSRVYFRLVLGDDNTLWGCGNAGIMKVRRAELRAVMKDTLSRVSPVFFDRADGMASAQCNGGSQPAGWRMKDGRILFPTARGVAVFDPNRNQRQNPRPPPVHLTQVRVDGESLEDWRSVALSPGTRRIEFSYVGLSFVDIERVRYRYRMEGFDAGWVDAGREQRATYTNLPAGNYRFQVIAANNDGVWNDIGASVTIEQRPSLFQTWWVRLALLLLLLFVLFMAYRLRIRSLDRQSYRLQSLVEARTQELAKAMDQLDHMAHADGLTGLANRRRLDEYLAGAWAANTAQERPLALLVIDVDHFKRYNDQYGHLAGDELLKQLAAVLKQCLRRSEDLVARYGGEEFMVVLPGAELEVARTLAESMRATVAANIPGVTISVGVASARGVPGAAPAELVAEADAALYRAKNGGRNRVEVAPTAQPPADE